MGCVLRKSIGNRRKSASVLQAVGSGGPRLSGIVSAALEAIMSDPSKRWLVIAHCFNMDGQGQPLISLIKYLISWSTGLNRWCYQRQRDGKTKCGTSPS